MDPNTGTFYPLQDVIDRNIQKISQSALNNFGNLPWDTKDRLSYRALMTFDAAGSKGGFVTVLLP
jgi:hypothetical protein